MEDLKDAVLIQQGAEGRVYQATFLGRKSIVKERFQKKYRHPILDEKLTSRRLIQEARNMVRCSSGMGANGSNSSSAHNIDTPSVYFVDYNQNRLFMEFIEGTTVRDFINTRDKEKTESIDSICLSLCERIGEVLSYMHLLDIVHGDLTTSNIMLREFDPTKVVLIDFGLSYTSQAVEDKAVDLYVLERAFLSTHPNSQPLFDALLKSYASVAQESFTVIQQLAQVRKRGRKKSMVG
eukprot:gb/GECH01000105.1/.p1 GENE.gb/GECH01000105.1/~~gb/GECH01000105.1/.p1  ORF type:complete len:237 (+),score=55.41 gb/GECH01000105.1/:1-711(+)